MASFLHGQIQAYKINRMWNYIITYNDIPFGDTKVENKTDIANLLSEVRNCCHSCEV
jgi:hypothetical protein